MWQKHKVDSDVYSINISLTSDIAGRKIPPLRMVIHGEGGTGKSRVIQTITKMFKARGVPSWLLKAAYTGIAASLINGETLHNIGSIPIDQSKGKAMSDEKKQKLQQFWQSYQYLIINECSMLLKTFLAELEKNITIGKAEAGNGTSFGGINIILCGDFHQFPPVAAAKNEPLYIPVHSGNDLLKQQVGRTIYKEFSTVVILKEQMRVADEGWKEMLSRLRYGRVTAEDIAMLRQLVIGHPKCPTTDVNDEEWKKAALVTPRHGVWRA